MIKVEPLEVKKIEEYGNIIKQKMIIKEIDDRYITSKIVKNKMKIEDKKKFIKEANKFIKNEIEKNLDILIKEKLEKLIKLYEKYEKNYPELIQNSKGTKITDEQKLMNYILRDIFNYDKIISNKKTGVAYEIAELLDVKVCPYCNRQYINTVTKNNNKITRPDFDHFYSKTEYPLFALSLYNLIPACKNCNSKKSSNSFLQKENLYPYEEGIEEFKVFPYELPDFSIKIEKNIKNKKYKKFLNNADTLYLEEIYDKSHRNIVKKIVTRKKSLEEKVIEQFNKQLGIKIDKSDLKNFLGYIPKEELKDEALGKLKNDIMDSLFKQ